MNCGSRSPTIAATISGWISSKALRRASRRKPEVGLAASTSGLRLDARLTHGRDRVTRHYHRRRFDPQNPGPQIDQAPAVDAGSIDFFGGEAAFRPDRRPDAGHSG